MEVIIINVNSLQIWQFSGVCGLPEIGSSRVRVGCQKYNTMYLLTWLVHVPCTLICVMCCTGLLNVTYDAMPAELVTLIVTEFGAIPPTSVPVILREYRQEPPL